MADALHWILGDFWHFCGAMAVLGLTFDGLTNIVAAARARDCATCRNARVAHAQSVSRSPGGSET